MTQCICGCPTPAMYKLDGQTGKPKRRRALWLEINAVRHDSSAMLQEQDEQASAAAFDKQLSSLGACMNNVQQEAAAAHSISSNLQQRFAAMEWRLEQTTSSCAATLRTMTAKHERLAGTLAVVKESANFSEAKCSALGSEIARMHRQSARASDIKENKPFVAAPVSTTLTTI